jgi:hypothetical protein
MQQMHEFFYDLRQVGVARKLADAIDAWRSAADAVRKAADAAGRHYSDQSRNVP